ncbi:MAG: hypothetical protein EHM91_06255 [Planctomycetota bacterium]|nr:MAG: hypothetical protein EHM91_06255 [Planctomycetota bacterium]
MANMPFELVGRRIMDEALCLIFKCAACGDKVSLVIRDTDPLKERYPVACMCGAEVNMFFGSPRVARNMLRALKREAEAESVHQPHRCHSPLLN